MIIQCPECGKKYKVAEDLIDVGGRLVRCAGCEYEWLARAEDSKTPIILDAANEYNVVEESEEVSSKDVRGKSAMKASKDVAGETDDLHSILGRERTPEPSKKSKTTKAKNTEKEDAEMPVQPEQALAEVDNVEADALPAEKAIPLEKVSNIQEDMSAKEKSQQIDPPPISEIMASFNSLNHKVKVESCSIWSQLLLTMLSLIASALIILLPAAVIWPHCIFSKMPFLERPLGYIGIYDATGVRVGKVSINSQHAEHSLEVRVDVEINNAANVDRFVRRIRFISYDAEMQRIGQLSLDISADIAANGSKNVQGVLHNLPLSTHYISVDIGDRHSLAMRDMGSLYRFTK
ncbi:MAG: zinc-ribbon domain-containing protein [Proteobacteria bacterium]|nr:zinc-ribbon domain-containing protein [Pseudomonadota bacterium]